MIIYSVHMGEILRHLVEKELEQKNQSSLAKDIGISQSTIHKILYTNTIMTVPILRKVAQYFRVPLTGLLDDMPAKEAAVEEADFATRKNEEEKLLELYRHLRRAGKDSELVQFAEYLVEREQNAPHTQKDPPRVRRTHDK